MYPYIKKRRGSKETGYVVGPPGLGDKNGNGEYYKDIATVVKKVLLEGYSVRVQNDRERTGQKKREGSFKIGAEAVKEYELDIQFHEIVSTADVQPKITRYEDSNQVFENDKNGDLDDERVLISIKNRQGQPLFRSALLRKYDNTCCITGCKVVQILEASHIVPHSLVTDYDVDNGLLMRSDIHTLFDYNLLRVDIEGKITVSDELFGTEYMQYSGKTVTGEFTESMIENMKKRLEN